MFWRTENTMAKALGIGENHTGLKRHVARLKKDNIRTIAKLDVFADHRLAASMPALSVMDRFHNTPWMDANGLHWTNPSDNRVWDYNIALARELAQMGFDEIQFDYVRFPSDGDLSIIRYPNTSPDFSKSDCIQSFLERAYAELKPLGVSISADVFGLTAWKADDFGVGQVLEKMTPYLDVVCPMFYPSHFPPGFLGKESPGEFPKMIMEASMRSIFKRTDKAIRPWVQGFWYRSPQIIAQMEGIENASGSSWAIWNPTGHYDLAYKAMADRSGTCISKPKLYPSMADLKSAGDRSIRGNRAVVNYTSFKMGYSILSLESSKNGIRSRYSSPLAILGTLEESIVDHILKTRRISFQPDVEPYSKHLLLSVLLCSDVGKDAHNMRPEPIYIDWSQKCQFSTKEIPEPRLARYAQANRQSAAQASTGRSALDVVNIAAISESIIDTGIHPIVDPPVSILSH